MLTITKKIYLYAYKIIDDVIMFFVYVVNVYYKLKVSTEKGGREVAQLTNTSFEVVDTLVYKFKRKITETTQNVVKKTVKIVNDIKNKISEIYIFISSIFENKAYKLQIIKVLNVDLYSKQNIRKNNYKSEYFLYSNLLPPPSPFYKV